MLLRRLLVCVLGALALVSITGGTGGCGRAVEPANRTLDSCVATCAKRANRQCSEDECRRGCEFILDRLLEKEGDNVVACVARTPTFHCSHHESTDRFRAGVSQ